MGTNTVVFAHICASARPNTRGQEFAAHRLSASFALEARHNAALTRGQIMFMPGGIHDIHCSRGDEPVTVRVLVDRETATTVQRQLELLCQQSRQRPFFDFDHEGGPASFWPAEFVWRERPQPGVYALGEWSEAGRRAIEAGTYRAFSPTFFVDEVRAPIARVICDPHMSDCMGGLVNSPAFRDIRPIYPSEALVRTSVAS